MTARPQPTDSAVLALALRPLLPTLGSSDDDEESLEGLIAAVAHAWPLLDRYKICRALDDSGWDVDEEVFLHLAAVPIALEGAQAAATAQWVEDEGLDPEYDLGDLVIVASPQGTHQGRVVDLNASQAFYLVHVDALGHVQADQPGVRGMWVEFEKTSPLLSPPS